MFDDALSITAERWIAAAATERKPDAASWHAAQAPLTHDHVAHETVIAAGTFGERTVAREIACSLDEIRDEISLDGPVAGGNQVDRRHRSIGLARRTIDECVVDDATMVRKAALIAIDFQVGIEVGDPVVLDDDV